MTIRIRMVSSILLTVIRYRRRPVRLYSLVYNLSVRNYGKMVGNAYASKYVFQELYDSTLTVARQIAEKNKFLLSGEYKASSGSEIDLGATNVARGSVRVTAGGATLIRVWIIR